MRSILERSDWRRVGLRIWQALLGCVALLQLVALSVWIRKNHPHSNPVLLVGESGIQKGEVFSMENLQLKRFSPDLHPQSFFFEEDQSLPLGSKAKRSLGPGVPLTLEDLEVEEEVSKESQKGRFQITGGKNEHFQRH